MGLDLRSIAPELLGYSTLLCGLLTLFVRWPLARRRLIIATLVLLGVAIGLAVIQESIAHRLSWTNVAVASTFTTILLIPGGVLGGWTVTSLQRRGLTRWPATVFAAIVVVTMTWLVPPLVIFTMIATLGFPRLN
jgi:hypothetical protein